MKTFKFSLVLRTRENTDVFISLDDNIYGIHSKRINILYIFLWIYGKKFALKGSEFFPKREGAFEKGLSMQEGKQCHLSCLPYTKWLLGCVGGGVVGRGGGGLSFLFGGKYGSMKAGSKLHNNIIS